MPLRDLYPTSRCRPTWRRCSGLLSAYTETLDADRRVLLDQYRTVDIARKVVGVGSVGTRCWMVLLLGRDVDDPLFLQTKEADPSVLEAATGRSAYQPGRRVVEGQRLMQAAGDIFLGWERVEGIDGGKRDFYVRQLRDWKGRRRRDHGAGGLRVFGQLCGWTLARAHARSGDRIAIAGYLGVGDGVRPRAGPVRRAYADQNEQDHRTLVEAIADGRVVAQPGI